MTSSLARTALTGTGLACVATALLAASLLAARHDEMDYGPFLAGTYIAQQPAKNETLKGIAIRLNVSTAGAEPPEGPVSGGYSNRPQNEIAGVKPGEEEIYKTQRYPCSGYKLNVPKGTYKVTLKFSDSWQIESGKRVFDVSLEGKKAEEKLDIIDRVGRDKVLDLTFEGVEVADGRLDIDFTKIKGEPSIAGIVIEGAGFKRKLNCGGPKVGDYAADWPAAYVLPTNPDVGGMIFDTELLRWSAGWTGGYLKLQGVVFDGGHGSNPSPGGPQIFGTKPGPGWAKGEDFKDPRAIPHGPLPREWARYRGLYKHGDAVVVVYSVGAGPATTVRESPGAESTPQGPALARTMEIGPRETRHSAVLCDVEKGQATIVQPGTAKIVKDGDVTLVHIVAQPAEGSLEVDNGERVILNFPPSKQMAKAKVLFWRGPEAKAAEAQASLAKLTEIRDLAPFTQGGPTQWTQPVETKGELSKDETSAYVVDKLTVPEENPFKSWMRIGGFDFFSDGRIAVSTWSGDVWIVSGPDGKGPDAKLEKLVWKRYAAGLFHALGLKVVKDVVYVHGRDQITRLADLNKDGEADFYECFNSDVQITPNFHEFAYDLHTDDAGNFYFTKGGPVRPGGSGWDKITPHHGCIFKLSPDGTKLEVVARGFRAPNGMGLGPGGQLTTGDNEGTWTPAVPLNWIKPGGFYGVPEFAGKDPKTAIRDNPLCWMPKSIDNSNGGQVWIPEGKFGPLAGSLLHMSYGTCRLYRVLNEEVGGQMQGGVVQLPLKFESGICRARFNPQDNCLYLSGLRGWQTNASRDAGLYRVRYTEKAFCFPESLHVTPQGIELGFSAPLDKTAAADPDNYQLAQWNYRWTNNYGSKHYKPSDPKAEGFDEVEIDDAEVSADGKRVLLKIANLAPVMQMRIGFNLKSAEGAPLKLEIHHTINAVGDQRGEIHPGEWKVVGK